jgi:hypothetical protein
MNLKQKAIEQVKKLNFSNVIELLNYMKSKDEFIEKILDDTIIMPNSNIWNLIIKMAKERVENDETIELFVDYFEEKKSEVEGISEIVRDKKNVIDNIADAIIEYILNMSYNTFINSGQSGLKNGVLKLMSAVKTENVSSASVVTTGGLPLNTSGQSFPIYPKGYTPKITTVGRGNDVKYPLKYTKSKKRKGSYTLQKGKSQKADEYHDKEEKASIKTYMKIIQNTK